MLVIEYFPKESKANVYGIFSSESKKIFYKISDCDVFVEDGCVSITSIETGDPIFKGNIPIFYF